ncbi:hypothetical protein H6P81_002101 [Aristolochia fimbriata]|uniref:Peptidase A1 domain-containing protein n=1 Tax=Aristolochia fimbriata TaxID=158543 RepID=A0AAV7FDE8_ARIFI|nr:hypothetical protein H6P81_002101 [Aristolochia fimbriata]
MASSARTIFICFLVLLNSISWPAKAAAAGIRLIRRDSPLSPYYNPNATVSDLATAAVESTMERVRFFQARQKSAFLNEDAQVRVRAGTGEYLMEFQIGIPAQPVYAVADTASELIWVQCAPCPTCATKRPFFDPSASLTYKPIDCSDSSCTELPTSYCSRNQVQCQWRESYGDGTFGNGELATETFTLGSLFESQTIPNVVFGCSHLAYGLDDDESGIVGLNRQRFSLPSRLRVSKFSYCLVSPNDDTVGSLLILGSNAVASGSSNTPILTVPGQEAFYYVTLEGISVGGDRLPIPENYFQPTKNGAGGFIVDSGARFIVLQRRAHDIVVKGVEDRVQGLKKVYSRSREIHLCYAATYAQLENTPQLTFHFKGADVVLTTLGTYFLQDTGVWCLGVVPGDSISIFGNRAQSNYNVGYDLEKNTISFASAECGTF